MTGGCRSRLAADLAIIDSLEGCRVTRVIAAGPSGR